jgi:hypothetical protein
MVQDGISKESPPIDLQMPNETPENEFVLAIPVEEPADEELQPEEVPDYDESPLQSDLEEVDQSDLSTLTDTELEQLITHITALQQLLRERKR